MYESHRLDSAPQPVVIARRLMWGQVVLGVLGILIILLALANIGGGAMATATLLLAVGIISTGVLVALILACKTRRKWVRIAIIVVEALLVLDRAIQLLTGPNIGTLLYLALSIPVIVLLARRDAAAWFDR
ncbi:hypothetical protein [Spongiactinospora sp. TRM90649]|uniref:hypothetical protein n=1 Tax=Spongiactinospora sp. TRM90649 TaxID=3031114 RepID=UPI0023F871C6|nr:hypothetical protein [Spongiactinospora sp. TRM90649]MDF5755571.1 hypothetical protein [Spongiactinospora sp. TRM90649]